MTDPVGRLPDGSEYLRYAGPRPLDAAWRLPEETRPPLERWLALRAALAEAGRLDSAIQSLIQHWAGRGMLVRPIPTAGRSHLSVLIELGIDAAVAASASVSPDLSKWPPEGGRRQVAELIARLLKQGVDITPAEVGQVHALLCPTLKPPALPGMPQLRDVERNSRGKFRRHMAIIVDAQGVRKEGAPPEKVLPGLVDVIRTNAGARQAGTPSIVRAAWVLHALGVVHPFYDGNGRVARALASVIMIRGGGFPLMLPPHRHVEYLHAVAAARTGDPAKLVHLLAENQSAIMNDAAAFLGRSPDVS